MQSRSSTPVPADAFDEFDGLPDGTGVILIMPFVLAFWSIVVVLFHH